MGIDIVVLQPYLQVQKLKLLEGIQRQYYKLYEFADLIRYQTY